MFGFIHIILFISITLCKSGKNSVDDAIINGITPDDLAGEEGFILEKYEVETEDGYVLNLWRFNESLDTLTQTELSNRVPVLMVHGIMDTGTFPMYNYRNNSMAYVLFDAGYDVWSLSTRGTTYSMNHKTFTTDSEEFWDFSFSQIGQYDIPAAIDFILDGHSIYSSVFLVGHSMGTTSIQALLTAHDRWNFDTSKVRGAVMLAPAIHIKGCQTAVIGTLLEKQSETILLKEVKRLFGTKSILEHTGVVSEIPDICYKNPELCLEFEQAVAGVNPDSTSIDKDRMYVYVNFYPAGSSVQAVNHLIQLAKRDVFADYDYGKIENKARYGTTSYPTFDPSDFPKEIPLYVMYGGQDALVVKDSAEKFIKEMQTANINDFRVKELENYSHGDFIFGMHAKDEFIDDLIEFFEDYN